MPTYTDSPLARRIVGFAFLVSIFGLTIWVLSPFLAALAWAGILAYVTWPLHQWVCRRMPGRDNLAALLMTLGVTATLLLPLVWVMFTVAADVVAASATLTQFAVHGLPPLPAGMRNWPGGAWLAEQYQRVQADPAWVHAQFQNVATRWLGEAARGYIQAVGVTVRSVVFGIVLTALAQGTLAGLGYWVAGLAAPALWGVITALGSLIPFVGPVVWIGLSLTLLANGETGAALGLFLWGALVVSWVDNLIRPLVISGPTQIPFLLVFLGALGGLHAFGLIGLFLGPVLLAVSVGIWREWLGHARPD